MTLANIELHIQWLKNSNIYHLCHTCWYR